MNLFKKIVRVVSRIVLVLVVAFLILLGYLTYTEYKPNSIEKLEINKKSEGIVKLNTEYTALNWNVGYFGMDKDVDFFMDGGKMVNPIDKNHVENNLEQISKDIVSENPDITFLQEVDEDSSRTYHINQVSYLNEKLNGNSTFAYNFKVKYIPYPIPPLGEMNSGIYTSSKFNMNDAKRYQLPSTFKYPVRLANLKRAFSVSYSNIENSSKKLVLVNAHLDAYDSDNYAKVAQTKVLLEFMSEENEKGNYIILGGDFNQSLKQLSESEIKEIPKDLWRVQNFNIAMLGTKFKLNYDANIPSARLNNKVYKKGSEGTYTFIIDGYIVSNNVEVKSVKTIDKDFSNSDHNPVKLEFKLK